MPETVLKDVRHVNETQISISNVPIGKTGLLFQKFRFSWKCSTGTIQEVVFHLHHTRNFCTFFATGKQPRCDEFWFQVKQF